MTKITPIFIVMFLLSACGRMTANTPGSEPLGTPTAPSSAACSPPSNWTIQYHRSGGFAGFDESLTLDSGGRLKVQSERPPADAEKTISEDQVKDITKLLTLACPFEVSSDSGTCADCFLYDLKIQMDSQSYSVQASDVTLTGDLNPLIDTLNQLLQDTSQ